VHGRDATKVHASDLTLDEFIDASTLAAAPSLPGPGSQVRTVLLTGATGFLGRYLVLEWLERMDMADGKLICLVRAKNDTEARRRLDATFDSSDPHLLRRYRELAADRLDVITGDKSETHLTLATTAGSGSPTPSTSSSTPPRWSTTSCPTASCSGPTYLARPS
jgi:fatty acid CoA ligase FadD9